MDTATEDRIREIVQDEIAKALAEKGWQDLLLTRQLLKDLNLKDLPV